MRSRPAAGVHVLQQEKTIVFVTVCTADRQPWLACDEAQILLRKVWTEATAWLVGPYVIMPDHLHFFAAPRDKNFTIEQWIKFWKSQFTKSHSNHDWKWLSLAFHRRLRAEDSYEEKRRYMEQNPVRAGLVKDARDWPFRGELYRVL